jgi:uncharacterized protein YjcR
VKKKQEEIFAMNVVKHFATLQALFIMIFAKMKKTIELALKMYMKGISAEAIAEVLEVQSASVKRWLTRAAEQCDKVNDHMMKNVDVRKVEMDELWVIIQKKSSTNVRL